MGTEDVGSRGNQRPLEAGIHTELSGRLTYGGYLRLDRLLSACRLVGDALDALKLSAPATV